MVYKPITNILLHCRLSKWIAILTTDCERIAHAMVIRLSRILGIFGTWFWSSLVILSRWQYIRCSLWPCPVSLEVCPARFLYVLYGSIGCPCSCSSSNDRWLAALVNRLIDVVSFPHRGICVEEIHVGIRFPIFHFAGLRFIPIHSNLCWYYGSCSRLLALGSSLIALLPAVSSLAPDAIIFCMLLIRSFYNDLCLLRRSWFRVVRIHSSPQMACWLVEWRVLLVDSIHIFFVIVIIITFLREVRRRCPITCVICRLPTMSFWYKLALVIWVIIVIWRGGSTWGRSSWVVWGTHRKFPTILLFSSSPWRLSFGVVLYSFVLFAFLYTYLLFATTWGSVLAATFAQRFSSSLQRATNITTSWLCGHLTGHVSSRLHRTFRSTIALLTLLSLYSSFIV